MRIIDLWETGRKTFSSEILPARTAKGAENFTSAVQALSALKPDFVSVALGAGGSARDGSHHFIEMRRKDSGLDKDIEHLKLKVDQGADFIIRS